MQGELFARKLLRRFESLGIKFPTPMLKVCEMLRIPVFFTPLAPFDGCYISGTTNKRLLILINSASMPLRQYFSIAHELGHIFLKHPSLVFLDNSRFMSRYDLGYEAEANAFASELLMPKTVLKPMGPMTAKEIADYCHVSLEAANIRVKQLGWM
jgi:Zn-dependent peptidase ImmA (M78 family)